MFAGLKTYSNAPPPAVWVDVEAWQQALYPYFTPDRTGSWRNHNSLLVESQVFDTPWSHFCQRAPCREGNLAVAFWGRLDNRAELANKFGLDEQLLESMPDAQLVLTAWRRLGESMPAHLLGDFALAIVDADAKRTFLARDPLGVKPLYYWADAQGFLFATTVGALRCLKSRQPSADPDWMSRYLLGQSMSHSQTAYREIFKLPPGHYLTVNSEGQRTLQKYHEWRDDSPLGERREPQWLEAYSELLQDTIRCRMASNYPLGTENSGGIDSASITAYLARFLGDPGDRLHSFGVALADKEPAYIQEMIEHCNIKHNFTVTSAAADSDERYQRCLQVLGYPEEHDMATGHTAFYEACQSRGIRTLFSGYGGDEVVTNPGSLLRLELFDNRRFRSLWEITSSDSPSSALPDNLLWRLLRFGKVLNDGRKERMFNADYLQVWNDRWPHNILRTDVVEQLSLYECFMESARQDAPYRRINDWIIHGLLQMPYVPTRLENCTIMAASYGVNYCWPLWDVRLVQQYLSTPSIEKVGPGGIGRYLHRQAIAEIVPQRVAWKRRKYMGHSSAFDLYSGSGIQRVAERACRQEADLHPAVIELIDREKWRKQIKRARQGGDVETGFGFTFVQSTEAIHWLNHWLHGTRLD